MLSPSARPLYVLMVEGEDPTQSVHLKKINHDSDSVRKLCLHLLIATKVKMAESIL